MNNKNKSIDSLRKEATKKSNKTILKFYNYGKEDAVFIDSFKESYFAGMNLEEIQTKGYNPQNFLQFHHTFLINGRNPTKSCSRSLEKSIISPSDIIRSYDLSNSKNLDFLKDILTTIPVSLLSHSILEQNKNASVRKLHGLYCIADDIFLPWALETQKNFITFVEWFNEKVSRDWILGSDEYPISYFEILNRM